MSHVRSRRYAELATLAVLASWFNHNNMQMFRLYIQETVLWQLIWTLPNLPCQCVSRMVVSLKGSVLFLLSNWRRTWYFDYERTFIICIIFIFCRTRNTMKPPPQTQSSPVSNLVRSRCIFFFNTKLWLLLIFHLFRLSQVCLSGLLWDDRRIISMVKALI